MTTEQILMYFQGVRPVGPGKWQALCPAHDDHDPSLSIAIGANGGTLLHCFPGCPPEKVVAAAGLTMGDLAAAGNGNGAATPAAKRRIVCSYDYTGAQGELLFQVVRFDPKDFRQRRPDGHGGWTWNVKDTPRVLYNLRSIIDADLDEWIIVAEGEKDCDALAAIGVVATCNPGGAGKWNKLADDSVLNGRRIAIIPDRDKAGREHAQDVAARLYGRAREVRIVELPGPGKDAADWIEAGGTAKALLELVEAAPVYRPTAAQPPAAPANAPIDLLVCDPQNPLPTAREFVKRRYHSAQHGMSVLLRYAEDYYVWGKNSYAPVADEEVKARLYEVLEGAWRITPRGPQPFQPTKHNVANVLDALTGVVLAPPNARPPCWLTFPGAADTICDPGEVIACRNGLLELSTITLYPATPRFFCTHALDIDFDPSATEPAREWLTFLHSLWPDDPESIETLQDWFGYVIGGDTRQHKMLLIVGPRRGGKGTIARVLRGLLGEYNVGGPTLAGLQTNFGLQGLIGKPLATISDARLSGRVDQQAVVERLLSISGEDAITVDRKHRDPITLQLPTRFMLLTNELPRLADTSGALASRFVVLRLTESWLGREDTELFDRLKAELPHILHWAIEGWRRMQERRRFVQPASAAAAIADLEDLGSPVGTFLRDRCDIGDTNTASADALFSEWQSWCNANGWEKATTKQTFGRDLRAALPKLKIVQPRTDAGRERWYEGVGLKVSGTHWHA